MSLTEVRLIPLNLVDVANAVAALKMSLEFLDGADYDAVEATLQKFEAVLDGSWTLPALSSEAGKR